MDKIEDFNNLTTITDNQIQFKIRYRNKTYKIQHVRNWFYIAHKDFKDVLTETWKKYSNENIGWYWNNKTTYLEDVAEAASKKIY